MKSENSVTKLDNKCKMCPGTARPKSRYCSEYCKREARIRRQRKARAEARMSKRLREG